MEKLSVSSPKVDASTTSEPEITAMSAVVSESMSLVDEEIDSLRANGRQRVRTCHGKKKLSRENLVKSVLTLFDKLTVRELMGELAISFDGEYTHPSIRCFNFK